MPTYAQARQAVSDAASPYLVQIRRLLEMAGLLSASGLDDGKVLPADKLKGDICYTLTGKPPYKLYYQASLIGSGAVVWVIEP